MIALLIGGTVVLCVGVLAIVFGIPVKEFSFGNTMILAGAIAACTGLVLIGLYIVGRELKNLTRSLSAGLPSSAMSDTTLAPVAIAQGRKIPPLPVVAPPKENRPEHKEETLFARDQPASFGAEHEDNSADDPLRPPPSLTPANAPPLSAPWQDEQSSRLRPAADGAERRRRDILFSSTRREPPPVVQPKSGPDDFSDAARTTERDSGSETSNAFESAWPQDRSQERSQDTPQSDGDRSSRAAPLQSRESEAGRERYQPPRRADAASVTIVKSGVVDSMAYSLYSDGSIEAQMPEGMVRFASIDELRSHLDQRG